MVQIAKILVAALALISLAGGIMGFVKAKSKASVIAGSISALLLAVSFSVANLNPLYGLSAALLVSILLEVHFTRSYLKSKKPMPAVPMMVCAGITSVAVLAALCLGH